MNCRPNVMNDVDVKSMLDQAANQMDSDIQSAHGLLESTDSVIGVITKRVESLQAYSTVMKSLKDLTSEESSPAGSRIPLRTERLRKDEKKADVERWLHQSENKMDRDIHNAHTLIESANKVIGGITECVKNLRTYVVNLESLMDLKFEGSNVERSRLKRNCRTAAFHLTSIFSFHFPRLAEAFGMLDYGEIRESYRDEKGVAFDWKFPDIFSIWEREYEIYYSPEVKALNSGWTLSIFTNITGDEECVWLYVTRICGLDVEAVRVNLSVRQADGTRKEIQPVQIYSDYSCFRGNKKYLYRSYLLEIKHQLAPEGDLTVICTVCYEDVPGAMGKRIPFVRFVPSFVRAMSNDRGIERVHSDSKDEGSASRKTQIKGLPFDSGTRKDNRGHLDTKGGAILRKHFKELLFKSRNHDVTLKVKDKEFKAHKIILGARSPVFAAMFTHGMKEAGSGAVSIEDCDPEAFGLFLEYIYTGVVENISLSAAVGLYYASDKYDFPDLKETCVKHMKASLSTSGITDVITLAANHWEDELLSCAVEFFTKHLEEILMTVEWQRFFIRNPVQANELYLQSLKKGYKKTKFFSSMNFHCD